MRYSINETKIDLSYNTSQSDCISNDVSNYLYKSDFDERQSGSCNDNIIDDNYSNSRFNERNQNYQNGQDLYDTSNTHHGNANDTASAAENPFQNCFYGLDNLNSLNWCKQSQLAEYSQSTQAWSSDSLIQTRECTGRFLLAGINWNKDSLTPVTKIRFILKECKSGKTYDQDLSINTIPD